MTSCDQCIEVTFPDHVLVSIVLLILDQNCLFTVTALTFPLNSSTSDEPIVRDGREPP